MTGKRVGEGLVPQWLESLLATPFFSPCTTHGDAARGECNMFCLDCPAASAFCFSCRAVGHYDHRVIQIRRSSYHDVVRVSEVQKSLDISGVQTYVINSARVVFLNERPQPKGPAASTSGASSKATAAHACKICARALLDPFRFCSIGCKLEGVRRGVDAGFARGTEGTDEGDAAGYGTREAPSGVKQAEAGEPASSKGPLAPPTSLRRRKGIPHRAPLGS
ncbi:unnamed protein product [Spirodela intermedia]|uniref:Uncharacterized protein n=1 Tax=Spirodela intermedia TaxID=51605 RepID=A0A7I8K3C5_SPIIN|nr:unnamed protein product [Spirodela intermedia]